MKECVAVELGLVPYVQALSLQRRLVSLRKLGSAPDILLLCEHSHVITMGRNGNRDHLQASQQRLDQMNVEFHSVERGGDITYHGPGQLVGYPVIQLGEIRRDVVWYVRQLEETLIRATREFGIEAGRKAGMTGVWVEGAKLAAIGVHISRWVTSHGFAYNVSTNLGYFDLIVPCGIRDSRITSLEVLLNRPVAIRQAGEFVVGWFGEVFGLQMNWQSRTWLDGILETQPELVF